MEKRVGRKTTQRVLILKDNLLAELQNRVPYKDIAEKYNVSAHTVYRIKDELAKELGIDPDSLLYFPKDVKNIPSFVPSKDTIDIDEMMTNIECLDKEIGDQLAKIKAILNS